MTGKGKRVIILYDQKNKKGGGDMAEYGKNGYIDFSKLWEILKEKKVNKQWLRNNGIHSCTISKLVKNENVTCEVIAHLCRLLNCQPSDFMEYKNGTQK